MLKRLKHVIRCGVMSTIYALLLIGLSGVSELALAVSGRLVDVATGKGIPQGVVTAMMAGTVVETVTTDSSGRFFLSLVQRSNTYVLNFSASGYAPVVKEGVTDIGGAGDPSSLPPVYATPDGFVPGAADCRTDLFDNFFARDGRTYAITKTANSRDAVKGLVEGVGARLAAPGSVSGNATLASKLGRLFTPDRALFRSYSTAPEGLKPAVAPQTPSRAWIGVTDPVGLATHSVEGGQASPQPATRFVKDDGFAASFTQWGSGEPDNYCTRAERQTKSPTGCYGENWVAMNVDGTWADTGNHGPDALKLKGIAEWQRTLNCVDSESGAMIPEEAVPGIGGGEVKWCTNTGGVPFPCINDSSGNPFCGMDAVACNAVTESPVCNNGFDGQPGVINSSRQPSPMCQTPSADSCPGTGGLSPDDSGSCYKDAYKNCPAGYSYSSAKNRCERTPQCLEGAFNPVTNKCERIQNTACVPEQDSFVYERGTKEVSGWANFNQNSARIFLNGEFVSDSCAQTGAWDRVEPLDKTLIPQYWGYANSNLRYDGFGWGIGNGCGGYGANISLTLHDCPSGYQYEKGVDGVARCINTVTTYKCPIEGGTACSGTPLSCTGTIRNVPSCPNGSFEDNGPSGDVCIAPYEPVCSDPSYITPAPGQPDLCVADSTHECPPGYAWVGDPVGKCEHIPVCDKGMYIPETNTCYNQQQTCPLGNFACVRSPNDTSEVAPGVPILYCSPHSCSDNPYLDGLIVDDPSTGINDKDSDGAKDAAGNCLDNIYIFNGKDRRCVKKDVRQMTAAIAKLVASVVLALTGAGAALGAVLGFSGTAASAVGGALINSMMQVGQGLALNGKLGMGDYISIGASLATGGAGAAGGYESIVDSLGDAVGGVMDQVTGNVVEAGSQTTINVIKVTMTNTADVLGVVNEKLGGALSEAQIGVMADFIDEMSPTMNASMLAGYGPTKCCNPDAMGGACPEEDFETWSMVAGGKCHIIGEYCAAEAAFVCWTQKQSMCCFDSKLARIIHEQGRPQLKTFGTDGSWGDVKSPNCRGFTPDEFQSLDFSGIDLSEYYADLTKNVTSRVNAAQKAIGSKLDRLGQVVNELRPPQLSPQPSP